MKRSIERILTTHTGSLPRPAALVPMLMQRFVGGHVDESAFAEQVRSAVRRTVERQSESGIDIVSDGEMGKPSFFSYATERLTGFEAIATTSSVARGFVPRDLLDFPSPGGSFFERAAGDRPAAPPFPSIENSAPIEYRGRDRLAVDLDNFTAALAGSTAAEAFLPAISPGMVTQNFPTTHYRTSQDYLEALAEGLRSEYQDIVKAGYVLQIDCPDLAASRHAEFADSSIKEFRAIAELRVHALNHALSGIDPDRVRIHICWGNYPGPHHRDVELRDILDIIYTVRANAISIEAANPRHAHEWRAFEERPLPDGKILIPGVIESCTNYIEHPQVVADRIVRFARVVGRERVIAGTDCGFGTVAMGSSYSTDLVYAKLASLAEGARLASFELWPIPAGA